MLYKSLTRTRLTSLHPFFVPFRVFCGKGSSLLAPGQGHHGEGGAGVGDEVIVVLEQRARDPVAALALVAFQPGDTVLDSLS
jgi:hypothetical protein